MDPLARNATVYDLLRDARLARYAANFARGNNDRPAVRRYEAIDVAKREEAGTIDPAHECPAWDDHARGTN